MLMDHSFLEQSVIKIPRIQCITINYNCLYEVDADITEHDDRASTHECINQDAVSN